MKKACFMILTCLVVIYVIQLCIPVKIDNKIKEEAYEFCKNNDYNTDCCFLVDFSKHSGRDRFYIYSFKEKKVIYKSLCAQGLGVNYNIFKSTFSNEIGSNYSSLGKYKVGKLRPMSNPRYEKGYNMHGLESSNSNALIRGILIHKGNVEFDTFPLPCLPVSKGCFGVSTSMMNNIEDIQNKSTKSILLYAYK